MCHRTAYGCNLHSQQNKSNSQEITVDSTWSFAQDSTSQQATHSVVSGDKISPSCGDHAACMSCSWFTKTSHSIATVTACGNSI